VANGRLARGEDHTIAYSRVSEARHTPQVCATAHREPWESPRLERELPQSLSGSGTLTVTLLLVPGLGGLSKRSPRVMSRSLGPAVWLQIQLMRAARQSTLALSTISLSTDES
jgi:hypothetical protein